MKEQYIKHVAVALTTLIKVNIAALVCIFLLSEIRWEILKAISVINIILVCFLYFQYQIHKKELLKTLQNNK